MYQSWTKAKMMPIDTSRLWILIMDQNATFQSNSASIGKMEPNTGKHEDTTSMQSSGKYRCFTYMWLCLLGITHAYGRLSEWATHNWWQSYALWGPVGKTYITNASSNYLFIGKTDAHKTRERALTHILQNKQQESVQGEGLPIVVTQITAPQQSSNIN